MQNIQLVSLILILTACDQARDVGNLGPTGNGQIQIQNLTARVTREYECAAGRVEPFDSSQGCSCNQSPFSCDADPGRASCLCDPGCVQRRPMIDCADYTLTFTLANGSDRRIERMTELNIAIGDFELQERGQHCDTPWAVLAGASSSIIEVELKYDPNTGSRFAEPTMEFPCSSGTVIKVGSGHQTGEDLGEPLPPASVTGSAEIEIRGLFGDASPWALTASAEL